MTDASPRFPAVVFLLRGSVVERQDGYYNSQVVGCRVGKADLAWPIALAQGEAFMEAGDKGSKRMFLCSLDFPEFAIPWEMLPRQLVNWRGKVLDAARKEDGTYDVEKLRAAIKGFGVEDSRAGMLANVLSGVNNPQTLGEVMNREWLSGLVEQQDVSWPLVVGGVVVGILEGWQLADTVLPNIADSMWFSLMLPLVLIGGLVLIAFREG